jgi:hypothetical protein
MASRITDYDMTNVRANAFFKMSATELVSQSLATPIGAALMQKSAWIPMFVSLGLDYMALILCLAFEETLYTRDARHVRDGGNEVLADSVSSGRPVTLKQQFYNAVRNFLHSTKFVWRCRKILLILGAFFLASFGMRARSLLLQYVSKRYGWSLAKVRDTCFF